MICAVNLMYGIYSNNGSCFKVSQIASVTFPISVPTEILAFSVGAYD